MCNSLLKEIEQCREKMIALGALYGLTADIVVQYSKRLDDLLNEYQKKFKVVQE
ncbi:MULTISPECIES: aspartyl-phosphate phosphatase Spo0E family protein [unclassified Virgibacillus]|uniref:aspartyl-phosphate phosphatase Spo0E family protein n=1 Tax=unclassified Virgibacillus TaxID=2620237 RepID=UPI0024DEE634|nr:aspartyl-phosphate phosphatase Spo0E family protein [Virgibacillus sp. LDC-1]